MTYFFRIYFFIFVFLTIQGKAQPYFDFFTAHHQYSFPVLKTAAGHKEILSSYNAIDISLPVKLQEDILVFSPSYENYFLSFRDSTPAFSVQGIKFATAFAHKWKAKAWKTTLVAVFRSVSLTKNSWNRNALQTGGAVVMAYEKNSKLTYKFGVYYNSEFFGPFILPLLGIDYRPSDRVKLFGILPGSMNIEYKISKTLRSGFSFRSITSSYRAEDNRFLRINDNQLRLFLDIYVAKKQVITLEAGHSILRKLKPGGRIGGEPTYDMLKTADGLLLKIGYSIRIRLDEKAVVHQE